MAPNSRYTFLFLRSAGTRLHEVQTPESSSQFRSRDVFPQLVAGHWQAETTPLTDEVVPLPPERVVVGISTMHSKGSAILTDDPSGGGWEPPGPEPARS